MVSHIAKRLLRRRIRRPSTPIWRRPPMHRPAIALSGIPINKPLHTPLTRIETVLRVVIRVKSLIPAHPAAVLTLKVGAVISVQAGLHVALPGRSLGTGGQVVIPAGGPVVVRVGGRLIPFDEAEVGGRAGGDGQGGGDGGGVDGWGWGLGEGGAKCHEGSGDDNVQ